MAKKKPFDILRIAFGVVWAIDAFFKWTPAFLSGLSMQLMMTAQGQPALIADWIGFFIRIISLNPFFFAVLVACIESALALCLIFDLLPQTTLVCGCIFSLVLWSVGEGFGGPYIAGSTDVGTAIIYAFVFAAIYFERFGKKRDSSEKEDSLIPDNRVHMLYMIIMVLAALIIAPYLITRTSTAQSTDMPPGMLMKSFALASTTPIPTISFTLSKDTLDGWDLHVTTTNFTWTPQRINTAPIADQGHVHLYIDGTLVVLFGPWYHIDSATLPPGKHTITVSLNANDHSVFTDNGQNIQSTQTLFVSPI